MIGVLQSDFSQRIAAQHTGPRTQAFSGAEMLLLAQTNGEQAAASLAPTYETTVENIYHVTKVLEENHIVNLQLSYGFVSGLVSKTIETMQPSQGVVLVPPAVRTEQHDLAGTQALAEAQSATPTQAARNANVPSEVALTHAAPAEARAQVSHQQESVTLLQRALQARQKAEDTLAQYFQQGQVLPVQQVAQDAQSVVAEQGLMDATRSSLTSAQGMSQSAAPAQAPSAAQAQASTDAQPVASAPMVHLDVSTQTAQPQHAAQGSSPTQPSAHAVTQGQASATQAPLTSAQAQLQSAAQSQAPSAAQAQASTDAQPAASAPMVHLDVGTQTMQAQSQSAPQTQASTEAQPVAPAPMVHLDASTQTAQPQQATTQEQASGTQAPLTSAQVQSQTVEKTALQGQSVPQSVRVPEAQTTPAQPLAPAPMLHLDRSTQTEQNNIQAQAYRTAQSSAAVQPRKQTRAVPQQSSLAPQVLLPMYAAVQQRLQQMLHSDFAREIVQMPRQKSHPLQMQHPRTAQQQAATPRETVALGDFAAQPLAYSAQAAEQTPASTIRAFAAVPLVHEQKERAAVADAQGMPQSAPEDDFTIIKNTRTETASETRQRTTQTKHIRAHTVGDISPQMEAQMAQAVSSNGAALSANHAEVAKIANKVYDLLEKRLRTEKNRRGMR